MHKIKILIAFLMLISPRIVFASQGLSGEANLSDLFISSLMDFLLYAMPPSILFIVVIIINEKLKKRFIRIILDIICLLVLSIWIAMIMPAAMFEFSRVGLFTAVLAIGIILIFFLIKQIKIEYKAYNKSDLGNSASASSPNL